MLRSLLLIAAATTALCATDPWAKVKDLKTGTELRIYKIDAKQPIIAKMDELTDSGLVVIIKNEQVGIDKDEIERIDYRPTDKGGRMTKENKTKVDLPESVGPHATPGVSGVPGTSSSSTVSVAGKADFETIYRRAPAAHQK